MKTRYFYIVTLCGIHQLGPMKYENKMSYLKITGFRFCLVNVISFSLSQSDHRKWLSPLPMFTLSGFCSITSLFIFNKLFFEIFFLVCPIWLLLFSIFFNVIACIIAYIYPVYVAGVWTHDLLVMSHLP